MNNIKIICFDLDNTLCKTTKNNYYKSTPIKKNISILTNYESGYMIKTLQDLWADQGEFIKSKKDKDTI